MSSSMTRCLLGPYLLPTLLQCIQALHIARRERKVGIDCAREVVPALKGLGASEAAAAACRVLDVLSHLVLDVLHVAVNKTVINRRVRIVPVFLQPRPVAHAACFAPLTGTTRHLAERGS